MALGTLGQPVGGAVMPFFVGLLITTVGWRNTWGLMGIIPLAIILPLLLLFMRSRPEDMGLQPYGEGPGLQTEKISTDAVPATLIEPVWTLREALSTRTFWLLVLAVNLANLGVGAVQVNLVPFLTEQEGISSAQAGLLLSVFYTAAICARLLWGFLVERIPVNRCLAILFMVRCVGSVGLVVVPYPFNVGSYIFLVGLLGGAMGLVPPMAFAIYYGRASYGSLWGFLRPLQAIPQMVSPLLTALLFDMTGTFNVAFLIASAVSLPAAVLALYATPPVHRAFSQPVIER